MNARSDRGPGPDNIRRARRLAGLSQTEAAKLVHCTRDAWATWEASAPKPMHPGLFHLFLLRAFPVLPAELADLVPT